MAAPTRVGTPVGNPEPISSSFTVDLPASPVVGNTLLAVCATAGVEATGSVFSTHADWTKIFEAGNNGANICECQLVVFRLVVDGTEPASYEITKTGAIVTAVTTCIEINGVNDANPINQTPVPGETAAGGVATHTVDEVTTDVDDCYVLTLAAVDDGSKAPATVGGTGWSEIIDTASGTGNQHVNLVVAEKTMSGQGLTVDCTVSAAGGSTEACYAQLAIEPEAGGITIVVPLGPVW